MKTSTRVLGGALLLLAACGAVAADAYPSRPIWIITPFTSAGATGLLARSIGDRLTAAWGQPVIVDGKPSGGGIVATQAVANAAADGYTLLIGTANLSIAPALYKSLPYNPDTALTPVIEVVKVPNVIVARPTLAAKSMAELIALAKSQPGKLNYASPGTGSFPHLVMEKLKRDAGVSLLHVPYRGTPAALTALMAGEVDVLSTNLADVQAQAQAGKVRLLAVTDGERFPSLPDVPTVAEAAVPGFVAVGWMGLFAPRGTPADIVDRLNREAGAALADPKMKEWLRQQGFEPVGGPSGRFGDFLKVDRRQWAEVVKYSGATID